MEEMTWIEVLSRQRQVVSRQRVAGETVTIGRAYDNDLVFDDPHMAAHHVRLSHGDDGAWLVEDLGSINGISAEGMRRERLVLDGDTVFQVGLVSLRVRTCGYEVAAEMPFARPMSRGPIALLPFASACALVLLKLWLGETGKPDPLDYLGMLLTMAAVATVWVSLWSVLSRVFTGTARYSRHLLIFGMGLLLFTLYAQFSEMAAFALSSTALATHTFVVGWLVLAATCFAHLRASGRAQLPLKAVGVVLLAVLGITMQALQHSGDRAKSGQAVILRQLQPPALRMVDASPETAFFTSAARLRSSLDKARAQAQLDDASGSGE